MATVPSQSTASVGNKVTASLWNDDVRDAVNFLLNPPRLQVYHSVDRTATTGTWLLAIFDSESWDSDTTMHSTSSNTSRLIAPVAGQYRVDALVYWTGNATGGRGVNFTKNGAGTRSATNSALSDGFATPQNNTNQLHAVSFEVTMAANDYLEMWVYQASGGNLNYIGGSGGTRVSMRWVSS